MKLDERDTYNHVQGKERAFVAFQGMQLSPIFSIKNVHKIEKIGAREIAWR